MFKILFTLLALINFIFAASSHTCKACHPTIYKEYSSSIHANSSIYNDKIFNALWNKHPLKKEGKFKCAKCHTPSDKALFAPNVKLQANSIQKSEPISCQNCHQIKEIHKGKFANENIYLQKEKYFYSADSKRKGQKLIFKEKSTLFGLFKSTTGSPYHDIDYSNEGYYNGNSCLGCHSHKKIENGFEVCSLEVKENKKSKESCIRCHMPKTLGSFVNLKESKTHASHAISLRGESYKELAKYIDLNITTTNKSAKITLKNQANHTLFVHPLRLGQLRVSINEKLIKTLNFHRVIGKDGKPTMPWLANSVVKDTTIKAFETKVFEIPINKGDRVEATLGYYLVNPKAAKKLGLTDKKLLEFRILKRARY